jgi:hypothetical protein
VSSPRIVRYLLTIDIDGDELVWAQYSSGRIQSTALHFVDVEGKSATEVVDLTGRTL